MSFAAFAPLAMEALGGSSASGAPPMAPDNFAPTSPINVAPVGVNFGEIIKGYEQGGVTNGGSGQRIPSRYASEYTQGTENIPLSALRDGDTGNLIVWGGASLAAATLAYFIFRKRG